MPPCHNLLLRTNYLIQLTAAKSGTHGSRLQTHRSTFTTRRWRPLQGPGRRACQHQVARRGYRRPDGLARCRGRAMSRHCALMQSRNAPSMLSERAAQDISATATSQSPPQPLLSIPACLPRRRVTPPPADVRSLVVHVQAPSRAPLLR